MSFHGRVADGDPGQEGGQVGGLIGRQAAQEELAIGRPGSRWSGAGTAVPGPPGRGGPGPVRWPSPGPAGRTTIGRTRARRPPRPGARSARPGTETRPSRLPPMGRCSAMTHVSWISPCGSGTRSPLRCCPGSPRFRHSPPAGRPFRWAEGPGRPGTCGGARLGPCVSGPSSCDWWRSASPALWLLGGVYVLVGYRPGGPIDPLVGLAALSPTAIALLAVIWPPIARGPRAFAAIVWLGLGAGAAPRAVPRRRPQPAPRARAPDAAALGRGRLPVAPGPRGDERLRRAGDRPAPPRRDRPPARPARPRGGHRARPHGRRGVPVHDGRGRQRPRPPGPAGDELAVRSDRERRGTTRVRRGPGGRARRVPHAPADGRRRRATGRGREPHRRAGRDGRPLDGRRRLRRGPWAVRRRPGRPTRAGRATPSAAGRRPRRGSPTTPWSTSAWLRPPWPRRTAKRPRIAVSSSSREPGPVTAGSPSTGRPSSPRSPRSAGSSGTIPFGGGVASSTSGSSATVSWVGSRAASTVPRRPSGSRASRARSGPR